MVSKPITDDSKGSVLAVVGIALRQSLIEELLFTALSVCSDGGHGIGDDDGHGIGDDDGHGIGDDDGHGIGDDGGHGIGDDGGHGIGDGDKCKDTCDNFCSYEVSAVTPGDGGDGGGGYGDGGDDTVANVDDLRNASRYRVNLTLKFKTLQATTCWFIIIVASSSSSSKFLYLLIFLYLLLLLNLNY